MPRALHLFVVLAIALVAEPALAFRCKNKIVKEGDPKAKVLNYCGKPVSVQHRTIYRSGIPFVRSAVPVGVDGTVTDSTHDELLIHDRSLVEVVIEEWTYNLGPHRLMRLVRFEDGLVAEVTGLSYGYLED